MAVHLTKFTLIISLKIGLKMMKRKEKFYFLDVLSKKQTFYSILSGATI
jgi:hypothetical protein